MEWEEIFMDQAARHEGMVAKFHLPRLGLSSVHWWRARRSGRWVDLSPRLVLSRSAPPSDTRRALAATMDAGPFAFLHGGSALAWLGMRNYSLRDLCVARARGGNPTQPTLAHLHRLRAVRPHDVILVRGVPTETALRAIWSEAARYADPRCLDWAAIKVGALLDEANRKGLCTWAGLHDMVDDIRQRGRAGTVLMRALAEARPPGSSPTDSRQEERLEKLLADVGAKPLRRQPVVGGQEPIGRTDHRDDDLPLVVEVNSRLYHSTPSDRRADEIRYQRLIDAGFTVGVVWEDDLWSDAGGATETVAAARWRAHRGEPVVVHSPGCPWPLPHVGAPPDRP
jgi:hypothetical protein